jgi:cytochrome c553
VRHAAAAIILAAAFNTPAAEPQPPAKARLCVPCHGPLGISVQPDAPNLAAQPRTYLSAQLAAYRSGKRSHEQMNVIARGLDDAEIQELAEWFASLAIEVKRPPG